MKTEVARLPSNGTKPISGSENFTAALNNRPLLCFQCCVVRNMGMAIKVLQASKVLLKRNAPKAHVERGINIARAMILDLVDHVESDHKKH